MKILQVNNVFGVGSTGRLTSDLHEGYMSLGHDSSVLYGRGMRLSQRGVTKTSSEAAAKVRAAATRVGALPYAGARRSTERILNHIQQEEPDVVHLQCINGYFVDIYRLIEFLVLRRQPMLITLHAEFMYTGGCGHSLDCNRWRLEPGCGQCPSLRRATGSLVLDRTRPAWEKMQGAFSNASSELVRIVSVSPWLEERARSSPILRHLPHRTILNGLDTSVFHSRSRPVRDGAAPIRLLHVTPFFSTAPGSTKGGEHILTLAQLLGPEYLIEVAGGHPRGQSLPENVQFLGRLDRHQLAEAYARASATVLTSRRETFSMVSAESLSCGTPVIGFEAGGPEQIALSNGSHFVPSGDVASLADAVRSRVSGTACSSFDSADALERQAHARYSRERMVTDYLELFGEIIQSSK